MNLLTDIYISLGIMTIITPLEIWFSKEGTSNLKTRLINIVYMILFFLVGGYLVGLVQPDESLYFTSSIIHNKYLYAFVHLLLIDIVFYLYHRLQHRVPLLWKVHKLHHSDHDMNITTSIRANLLEHGLQYFILYFPVVWVMGSNREGMQIAYYLMTFFLFFAHLKLDIQLGSVSKFLVTPNFHRVHHSRERAFQNKNFSQFFSFIDWVGGTYSRPVAPESAKDQLFSSN